MSKESDIIRNLKKKDRIIAKFPLEESKIRTEGRLVEYDIPAEVLKMLGITEYEDITIELYRIPGTSVNQVKLIDRS